MKKIVVAIITFFIIFLHQFTSAQQGVEKYKIGQKVEAWNVGWYKATILEIGSGEHAGYIKVHYDDYSSDQYLKESSIRTRKSAPLNDNASGPRNGRYTIQSYGGNISNPLILGYFDLNNGKYSYYNAGLNLIGTGTYLYDAGSKKVLWQSGDLKKYSASAGFEITREGKTHNIRLKYGTSASNSTDSKK
ncbi:MAG: MBT domain-containing protein [Daejeonella sp.]